MTLRATAPGKVNLCLYLGPPRGDGRHELVTVFESLSVADEVALDVLPPGTPDQVICPRVEGENLAAVALARLREAGWAGPPVRIVIDKHVPVAAGMGGGSADAAAALRLAAALVPVPAGVLEELAAGLGADVPAQVRPGVWLGTGAGERLEPIATPAPHRVLVVPLPHALATPAVFGEADRLGLGRSRDELAQWAAGLRAEGVSPERVGNDLEPAAISLCPAVGEALGELRALGAAHAIVCGSGPTVAGLWWGDEVPQAAVSAVRERYPMAQTAVPVGAAYAAPRQA